MTKKSKELEPARAFLSRQFPQGAAVLCAVSGGLDSMCLLHLMSDWGRTHGFAVTAAHFNHQLRGEDADRDEAFVRSWCAAREIPFLAGRGDVRAAAEKEGLSVEEAARKLRYGFLREAAEKSRCAAILTAHHAGDSAETLLLNLVRGTGLKGLCGIPPSRDGVLRPFLQLSRDQLAEYAAAHRLPHREDATNEDPGAASRNLIRLEIMPLLREINPEAAEHMARTAAVLRETEQGLSKMAEQYLRRAAIRAGQVSIPLAVLAEVPDFLLPQVLLGLFDRLGAGRKDIGSVHLEALRRLIGAHGGRISLPHGITARLAAAQLLLETRTPPVSGAELERGHPLRWGVYTLTLLDQPAGEGLALRSGPEWEPVFVAPCPPGARLTLPETNGGARTVKRLCADRGIPFPEREQLPAVYLSGRLAAVWRLGVNTQFLPAGNACRFIQIIKEKTEEREHDQ